MDFMDIDQVVEVPDTPERFISTHGNDRNTPGTHSDGSSSCRVITKDSINETMRNDPREKGKSVKYHGNRRLFVRPDNNNSSSTSKNSFTTLHNAPKGEILCNSSLQNSTYRKSSSFVDLTDQNMHDRVFEIDTLDTPIKSSGITNTDKFCQRFDRGKGVITGGQHKVDHNSSMLTRLSRQKTLVISPHNIAKSKEVIEKHENGKVAKDLLVDIENITTEGKISRGLKGKQASKSSNNLLLDKHNPLKKVNLSLPDGNPRAKVQNESKIYNHFEDLEINCTQRVSPSPSSSLPGVPMASHRAHKLGQLKERAQLTKRQREGGVVLTNNIVPRVSGSGEEPSTSRSTRNKNSRGSGGGSLDLDPVIEIDEVSVREYSGSHVDNNRNEDPGVRALQVEADEMLARELQEQLYNEELASAFGADEMDSHLAWETAMQQEHFSHSGGRPAYRPSSRGGSSVSNMHQNSRSSSSRNPSSQSQRGGQGQGQGQGQSQTSTTTRLARLRGRFPGRPRSLSSATASIFPSNMDLDMRMQILEALEAFNDMDMPNNDYLQVGREFNENDYEMLLALDDNNHQHGGATHAQINNLPQSTVQAENLQECAICLETPTIGETVRHLPCLHGFHKDCIDEWLRRKTSCPVCKSSVT